MARADIKLIIESERKIAEEKRQQLAKQYQLEIQELTSEYAEYRSRRAYIDLAVAIVFIFLMVMVILS